MGFMDSLKALFAGQEKQEAEPSVEYKGFQILVEPVNRGGQFGVGARITKLEGDQQKEHRFIRADVLPNRDACIEVTLNKAKMTIDQLGDRIFS
ncbi:MAG: transcriptional regulator [Oceanospirillaceae bacterium]|nr:transcriptional regulator [Oceanospirillaceae bacterium]